LGCDVRSGEKFLRTDYREEHLTGIREFEVKRLLSGVLGAGVILFIVMQFIRPAIPRKAATAEIQLPPRVRAVLSKDCYSCHSDERRLSWFDEVQPAYWLVRNDILTGRAHLNFSTIGLKPKAVQDGFLYESVAMVQLGAMPLPRYTWLHPEAKVTPQDLETLKQYLSPWSSPIPEATAVTSETANPVSTNPHAARPSLNGLPYDGSWPRWKLLAVTDRGDTRQFRLVLGNEIAVAAARKGEINPWPDGARFAKVAWLQERTPNGLIVPGRFWQIELMVKGARQYKATEGWGWARWRGLDLKPYGEDAAFVNECTSCHRPMRANDYVYTLPFSAAKVSRPNVLNNAAVRFPKGLSFDPLTWTPVTVYIDPRAQTISMLFARDNSMATPAPANGSERVLVTWTELDDPHWFGARMAGKVVSVETAGAGFRPLQIP
jgi:mono/diheme cytochrome c family protein